MSELTLQWIQGIKLLTIVVCAMLYAFGGMKGKWKRRFLSPSIYVAVMIGISFWVGTFNLFLITLLPFYIIGFCMGYSGRDGKFMEVVRRLLCGIVVGLAPIGMAIFAGEWSTFGMHCAMCIGASLLLGTLHFTKSARAEETVLSLIYFTMPIMALI